jgi:hypothetical protein
MSAIDKFVTVSIRKRPAWYWVGAIIWLGVTLLFLNTAIGSSAELEPSAASVNYVLTAILLVIGVVIYVIERRRAH